MGNVYLATHLGTTRVVAVIAIAPRWGRNRMRHPNIVNVTVEFLDGQTLSDFLHSRRHTGMESPIAI